MGLPCFVQAVMDELAPASAPAAVCPRARILKSGILTAHRFGWSLSASLARHI